MCPLALHITITQQPSTCLSSNSPSISKPSATETKRHWLQMDSRPSYTGPCLLPLLHPVRLCLHPFITSADAVRLMRASRVTTASLLADYAFIDRVFQWHYPYTIPEVKRSLALYARYHMRLLCMCLPKDWNESLIDGDSGRSVLPASLIALTFGQETEYPVRGSIVHAAFDDSERRRREEDEEEAGVERQFSRRVRRWERDNSCDPWSVFEYTPSRGLFNQPLPPGALPHGLRFLQFNRQFNQPLQVGSIPDTVEVLQFGDAFNQPLRAGQLPASLTRLVLGLRYNQPLEPGVLPASLQQLHLGGSYDQPLRSDMFPPQLRGLYLGAAYNQPITPGSIPASVTHLRLSERFDQPLQSGSIPHGVVHLSFVGDVPYGQPLSAGVFPTSLRELVIGRQLQLPHHHHLPHFPPGLQPGSLPHGLELLAFHQWGMYNHVRRDTLPTSVSVLSLSKYEREELTLGDVPAAVRWLRLPASYAEKDLSAVLYPTTRVVWWK